MNRQALRTDDLHHRRPVLRRQRRILHPGHAFGVHPVHHRVQRLSILIRRQFRQSLEDEVLRALPQNTGGLAHAVAGNRAAFRVGRRREDARLGQRGAVGQQVMVCDVDEINRMPR